jgi:protein involved in polysaccharide export with SLBB domain
MDIKRLETFVQYFRENMPAANIVAVFDKDHDPAQVMADYPGCTDIRFPWGFAVITQGPVQDDRIRPGDLIKIICAGGQAVGRATSVYWDPNDQTYGIELIDQNGKPVYWKQWTDGGSVVKLRPDADLSEVNHA